MPKFDENFFPLVSNLHTLHFIAFYCIKKMNATSVNSIMSPSAAKRRRLSFDDENEDQKLGFPEPILYYLKKNASPKLLLKLMQASKYFCYKEFPYMVVKDLKYDQNKWLYCKGKYLFNYDILDLGNLSKPLWITKGINCYTEDQSLVSRLLSKTAVCDIKNLRLEDQIISMKEFQILIDGGNVQTFTFCYSHVVEDDDDLKIVEIDKILKRLPNVKGFRWLLDPEMASTFTKESTKKLVQALNSTTKLSSFCLMNIPALFDFKLFSKYMEINSTIDYFLDFDVLISNEYSRILQEHVDKLIKYSGVKYAPLQIRFPNQTEFSINALQELHKRFIQRK